MWPQPRKLQPNDISLFESLGIVLSQYLLEIYFQLILSEDIQAIYHGRVYILKIINLLKITIIIPVIYQRCHGNVLLCCEVFRID